MSRTWVLATLLAVLLSAAAGTAEDDVTRVRKAVEKSTLDQAHTKPFHMKATLGPSRQGQGVDRTGEVEIWWMSPTRWRREVRSVGFHQVEIVDGSRIWQKSEGEYFPEWLREISVALVRPVANVDDVLKRVEGADVSHLFGTTDYGWQEMSRFEGVEKSIGGAIQVNDKTGLLMGGTGLGWSSYLHDYRAFHGQMYAGTVTCCSPEVAAKVVVMEDLPPEPADFFNVSAAGSDSPVFKTVVMDEASLRKNMLPTKALTWPALKDGPLDGVATTEIVVDRQGSVREVGIILADNPGIEDAASEQIAAMRFSPMTVDGLPVQVVSRLTFPFKTVRPPGQETFESARSYFERGRQVGFLAAGKTPYVLRGEFSFIKSGVTVRGTYEDTWISETEWKREARAGGSVYVRSRDGKKMYQMVEGTDSGLLKFVVRAMEPIPAGDTFVESDWRIRRDTVDGVATVRVLSGAEAADGTLDSQHARGYWFDANGQLVRTFFNGLETRRSKFGEYAGAQVARHVEIRNAKGQTAVDIEVTSIAAPGPEPEATFVLKGHDWERAFTDEVR